MSDPWRLRLTERKITTFTDLYFDSKITYGDAVLILTAVVSALASQCWPGRDKGFDRRRFTQLLVNHAPETRTISVPLLMKHFESAGKPDLAEELSQHLYKRLPSPAAIPLGHVVDLSEKDVEKLLKVKSFRFDIRNHSYVNLLYKELRCSYSHEFKPGDKAEVHRPTRLYLEPCVSYQPNSYFSPDSSEIPLAPSSYQIHFDLPWIGEVLRKCADAVDKAAKRLPRKPPKGWWIDGGRCYHSRRTRQ